MRRCSRCGETKEESEFAKNKRRADGIYSWCKVCKNKTFRERYAKDEKFSNRFKKFYATKKLTNPSALRNTEYMAKYGITVEQFEQMRISQNNRCSICNKEFIKTPCIDHNHETGKVRSLLCMLCNRGLGLLRDDINIVKNAFEYLSKWEE